MKIGYNGMTAIKKSNFMLDLECAEKYGFDSLEPRMSILDDHIAAGGSIEQIVEFFASHRIKPDAMNSLEFFNNRPKDIYSDKLCEFTRMCKAAHIIGSRSVIVVPSYDIDESFSEIVKNTAACLDDLCGIAADYSIDVAFEFVGFKRFSINTLAGAMEVIGRVKKSNIGLVIDLYHFYINGSDLTDIEKLDSSKLLMVHLDDAEDFPVGSFNDDVHRVLPGDGVIQYGDIFTALRKIGYDGTFSVELFNEKLWEMNPENAISLSKKKADEVMAKYWK